MRNFLLSLTLLAFAPSLQAQVTQNFVDFEAGTNGTALVMGSGGSLSRSSGGTIDANSHTPSFVAPVDTKADDANTSCSVGPATAPSTLAEDQGYAVIKTTNTTQISFIYSGTQTSGNCTSFPTGTGQDASISAEFK